MPPSEASVPSFGCRCSQENGWQLRGEEGDWAEDLKGDRKGKSKLNKTLRQQIH